MTLVIDALANFNADENLDDYLRFKGWSPISQGPFGVLWGDKTGNTEVAVPKNIRPGSGIWNGTLEIIAEAEGATPTLVDKTVRRFWMDVTDFRATSSIVRGDRIAAEAGSSLFSGAWKILRSSATTARGSKVAIGGNYLASGDKTIENAMFAQTEPGSYILPLLVPIRRPLLDELWWRSEAQDFQDEDGFFKAIEDESAERRVTRTMAQAMSAVYKVIIEPAKDPTPQAISEVVVSGASRELVKALHDIVSEETVSGLDVTFNWAPKGGPIPSNLTRVEVPKESAILLKRAFIGMKSTKARVRAAVSGPIQALSHPKGQDFGEATIEAAYKGRIRRITVSLRGAQTLDDAHQWFRAHETLLVTGTVRPTSEGLRIDAPEDLRPIGQTLLFDV